MHTRFGFAAQVGSELETGLVMLVSQSQQLKELRLTFHDLLEHLEANGELTLGRLVMRLDRLHELPMDLKDALLTATRRRNFLIHHFYRHRADRFHTPQGCEQLKDELVCLQDDLSAAVELLKYWMDDVFGARSVDDIRDDIRRDLQKWRSEQSSMLKAIVKRKDEI
ncbi:MAG TPA: hypothetical protein PKZ76_12110 [Xanthomonadaceae bacterium]|nr:hypothetical protein [Xanthomonadaceae bacterium]